MTKQEEKILDKLYQITILSKYGFNSILGGKADCVHHYKAKAGGYANRWYVPNGICLSVKQHNDCHGRWACKYEDTIKAIKGKQWAEDLERRRFKIVKNLDYKKVREHILGLTEDYI